MTYIMTIKYSPWDSGESGSGGSQPDAYIIAIAWKYLKVKVRNEITLSQNEAQQKINSRISFEWDLR